MKAGPTAFPTMNNDWPKVKTYQELAWSVDSYFKGLQPHLCAVVTTELEIDVILGADIRG